LTITTAQLLSGQNMSGVILRLYGHDPVKHLGMLGKAAMLTALLAGAVATLSWPSREARLALFICECSTLFVSHSSLDLD
jgi:hypothetical protein